MSIRPPIFRGIVAAFCAPLPGAMEDVLGEQVELQEEFDENYEPTTESEWGGRSTARVPASVHPRRLGFLV